MFLISFILFNLFIAFLFILYKKLTCGICKCSRHLVGKVVIVTGGNNGIGYETAKSLAERGARVILGCRSEARGAAARDRLAAETGNPDVHYRPLDLASLASVRQFAQTINATEEKIDILINNAGIYDKDSKTEDGLSLVMQVNHYGHFLLTSLLLPLLKSSAPSRIINVSSVVHRLNKFDIGNINAEEEISSKYSVTQVYGKSKLYNVLFAAELSKRLSGTGVTAYSLHPGLVDTDILVNNNVPKIFHYLKPITSRFVKTPWEGAQTTIYLAVTPDIEKFSGSYFSDCKLAKVSPLIWDAEIAKKMWQVSEELVKLK